MQIRQTFLGGLKRVRRDVLMWKFNIHSFGRIWMLGWGVTFLSVLSVFCGSHKYMVPYVKEVISTLQNINLRSKRFLKIKKFSSSLAPASGSEGVTKIKWKEREMSFHPHFVMKGPHLCVIEDMDEYFEKKLVLLLLLFIKLRVIDLDTEKICETYFSL